MGASAFTPFLANSAVVAVEADFLPVVLGDFAIAGVSPAGLEVSHELDASGLGCLPVFLEGRNEALVADTVRVPGGGSGTTGRVSITRPPPRMRFGGGVAQRSGF